jgi:hypothetical protein
MRKKLPLILALFTSGCPGVGARPLAALVLKSPAPVEPALRTGRQVAVCRFSDERGDLFGRDHPANGIPLVNLFFQGSTLEYPDHAGAIRQSVDGREQVSIGGLDEAIPRLLVETLRKSGAARADVCGEERAAPDYVLEGRLRAARFRSSVSGLLAATLGLFGVPFVFTHFELEYELTLFAAADPFRPLWQRTFRARDARAGGFYYLGPSVHASLVRALEQTLPCAAQELASAALANESRALSTRR